MKIFNYFLAAAGFFNIGNAQDVSPLAEALTLQKFLNLPDCPIELYFQLLNFCYQQQAINTDTVGP